MGNLAYYVNDRFLLSVPDELADSLITLFAQKLFWARLRSADCAFAQRGVQEQQ